MDLPQGGREGEKPLQLPSRRGPLTFSSPERSPGLLFSSLLSFCFLVGISVDDDAAVVVAAAASGASFLPPPPRLLSDIFPAPSRPAVKRGRGTRADAEETCRAPCYSSSSAVKRKRLSPLMLSQSLSLPPPKKNKKPHRRRKWPRRPRAHAQRARVGGPPSGRAAPDASFPCFFSPSPPPQFRFWRAAFKESVYFGARKEQNPVFVSFRN